ncbi:MAG: hypothetical protein OXE85_09270, partial [Roseovarius sp.]|nr:hypothetical protein [Roseovarius sp.]
TRRNAKGSRESWTGCGPRINAADGGAPVGRVTYLHELIDAAHDAPETHRPGGQSGHVAIIDVNPRRDRAPGRSGNGTEGAGGREHPPKAVRHINRSTVERVNARLKDEFGGRHVRFRCHAKVFCAHRVWRFGSGD